MSTIDNTPDELEALREENRRLRLVLDELNVRERTGISRKSLLAGGAGALAATAGVGMLGRVPDAVAAPAARRLNAVPGAVVPGAGLQARFWMQITGATQGVFVGDVNGDGFPDLIVGMKYDTGMATPFDQATGQTSGKRQHKPFVIVKEIDAASPMFFKAQVNNEVLTSVSVYIPKPSAAGPTGTNTIYRVDLTNARVVDTHQYIGNALDTEDGSQHVLESVSFTYQKITWTSVSGGKTASDDWSQ